MVPQWVVELEALPLTPNGKLDRDALPAPEASLQRDYAPPRDVVEFKVAKVWEEVLGVGQVGVRDNFFDLGGHSLAAVRLMAHLRGMFGKELPLSALFQNGTVEELSRLLREAGDPSDSSPLVGINTSGTRPPFFCVHPAGGNVLCYAPLARHLGDDQPFYGLQAIDGDESEAAALEETAARYAEAMRAVQPKGPYHLGGWSLGGPLAFEIARQLRASGERVALLALFDSWAPLAENKPWGLPDDESKLLAQVARSHRVSLPKNGGVPPGEGELLERAFEAANEAGLLPPGVGVGWLRRLVVQHGRSVSAVLEYEPAVYDGQVTLFRAREGAGARGDWGWGRLSSLPVNVRGVAGDHHTMLSEPHVGELAAGLDACLRAASAG
jgi:thioesterase domain-containing protein/acyl carrier protein